MRIAALIYGEPREIEYCKQFWPFQYLANHTIDYYYSIWATGACTSWMTGLTKEYVFDYDQIKEFNPVRFICLTTQNITVPNDREYRHAYILQKGLNLISDICKNQYDAFVLMRPDIFFSPESIASIERDITLCVNLDCSAIISNNIWTEDIFMILTRQDFNHLKHSNIVSLITSIDDYSVIHSALTKIFLNSTKFLPETRNYIEVVRPSVVELRNPTLTQVKQKFYEWSNFKRIEI